MSVDKFISPDAFEKPLWEQGFNRVMGLDEVGRGCLAGPVVAAGVILDSGNIPDGIFDSKQLSPKKRLQLSEQIKECATCWTIQVSSPAEIDEYNILWASLRAMDKCTAVADAQPDYLLVDGNRYLPVLLPHQCVIKGDSRCVSIAAASILAKVHRDAWMVELHKSYPEFGWERNVGYPTREHYDALARHGVTPWHRKSFKLRTALVYSSNG